MQALIVEDDPDVQMFLNDVLETYPWEFTIRSTDKGMEAIRLAQQTPPDLVLLDVRLKDNVDGYEVARQLRSHPSTVNARIVMLSALDDPVDQHLGKRAGANEYITKPVQNRILLAVLKELLEK